MNLKRSFSRFIILFYWWTLFYLFTASLPANRLWQCFSPFFRFPVWKRFWFFVLLLLLYVLKWCEPIKREVDRFKSLEYYILMLYKQLEKREECSCTYQVFRISCGFVFLFVLWLSRQAVLTEPVQSNWFIIVCIFYNIFKNILSVWKKMFILLFFGGLCVIIINKVYNIYYNNASERK